MPALNGTNATSQAQSSAAKVMKKLVEQAQLEELARRTSAACIGVYFAISSAAFWLFGEPRFWEAVPCAFLAALAFCALFFTPFNFMRTLGRLFAGFYAYMFYNAGENACALAAALYFLCLSLLTFKMSPRKSMCALVGSIAILMYLAYLINQNAL